MENSRDNLQFRDKNDAKTTQQSHKEADRYLISLIGIDSCLCSTVPCQECQFFVAWILLTELNCLISGVTAELFSILFLPPKTKAFCSLNVEFMTEDR